MSSVLPAIIHSFRLGWRGAWEDRGAVLGGFITYAILLVLWAGVWFAVPDMTLNAMGLTHTRLVWYVGMTELLVFVAPAFLYRDIEEDIRSGQIISALTRPVGYEVLKISAWVGHCVVTFLLLGPLAFVLLYILTGHNGFSTLHQAAFPVLFAGGVILLLLLHGISGFCAAWLPSARLLRMVIFKLMFVFGGLVLPLSQYPDWLQTIAWMTPFPALMYGPGSLMLDSAAVDITRVLGLQAFWILVLGSLLLAIRHLLERKIMRTGGV
ncbi:MAG: hypothetical protein M3O22_00605 [Pseudomonadota bacterium]|nr:hypothetical protein [Pseudomonadota bacterium]